MNRPCAIVTIKAFGDFVIALSAVGRVQSQLERRGPMLIAGQHLHTLAAALGATPNIRFIGDDTWTDVPAAFNIRKCGKVAAARSLLDLRRRLSLVERGSVLLFDQIGWRESFIAGGHTWIGLPRESENIYFAYERMLTGLGFATSVKGTTPTLSVQSAIIVPGSRIARKSLPAEVIAAICQVLGRRGIQSTVITLDKETVEVPVGVHSTVLPRTFDALVAAVKATDMVISADSLTAHLGEYHGLPTFVVTPAPNQFWLPQSAYCTNGWATFDKLDILPHWLDRCSGVAL